MKSSLVVFACGILALASCTRQKDTFQGNAEAYSGLRPKDGQYVWFDPRVSCTKNNITESGYRGVITVAGSAPIQFRAACSSTNSEVKPKDLQITEVTDSGAGTQMLLQYAKGLYDPATDPSSPPSTGTTRAWANFSATGLTYEVIVRGGGTLENMTNGRALVSSKTTDSNGAVYSTLLANVAVTAPTQTSNKTIYTGTDFSLTIDKLADDSLKATLVAKISSENINLNTTDVANTFLNPPPPSSAWRVSAGGAFTCATNGSLAWCWGYNGNGALGDTTMNNSRVAVPVHNLSGSISGLATGMSHACAIVNKRVMCWGENSAGQLGVNPAQTPRSSSPILLSDFGEVSKIAAGFSHTCAIVGPTSKVFCWGDNARGQLGRVPDPESYNPREVSFTFDLVATSISAGTQHTCVSTNTSDTKVWCWGSNIRGQLGNGTTSSGFTPVGVSSTRAFTRVVLGGDSSCAMNNEGDVSCWGSNEFGVACADAGTGCLPDLPVKTPVDLTAQIQGRVTDLSLSSIHACGILTNKNLVCWGKNESGQFGRTNAMGPTELQGASPISGWGNNPTQIAAGSILDGNGFTLVFDFNRFAASGFNEFGQLGDNSVTTRTAPVPVPLPNP